MGLRPLPRRIGMFGGAFDPPHNAHLALARAAMAELQLDVLHVVPTGHAWHKARVLSAAADRLAMCRLAFGAVTGARVDARELGRPGASYTIDTLRELQVENAGADLYLVIGADQAEAFHTWHGAAEIVHLARIAIAVRAQPEGRAMTFDPAEPLPGLRVDSGRVQRIRMEPMVLSATQLRQCVAAGQSIAQWTPPAVAAYIETHHLYSRESSKPS